MSPQVRQRRAPENARGSGEENPHPRKPRRATPEAEPSSVWRGMGATPGGHGRATRWRPRARWASLEESDEGGTMNGAIICGVDDSESAKEIGRASCRER